MVGTDTKQPKEMTREEHNPLLSVVRKILLAAIGAVVLAQEELENFVNRLVERGEIAQKDGKVLIRDLMEQRKQEVMQTEKKLDDQIEGFLRRRSVLTRSDLETLSAKIAELNEKLDELEAD
jgi:poly(hydroxyalkanoate) granule-associated protein